MKKAFQPAVLGLALLGSTPALSFEWGATDVQYLKGSDYVNPFVPEDSPDRKFDQDILTVEHANGWKYGDNFFFVDASSPSQSNPNPSIYFEWAPRISSKKTLGVNYSGLIADVLLSTQYNAASGFPVYLYGAAVDLNIPGFNFFQTNFYVRDDRNLEGTGFQVTLVWGMNFKAGIDWEFAGFVDYAGEEGDDATGLSEANLLTQPAILAKLTPELGVGLEYQYWSNKLGVKDANESVPQLLVKVQF
jgi:nucleoside-specific outer membrane channel protein Tsx